MGDLRRGLDVFSADGVYVGTVVHVTGRPAVGQIGSATPEPAGVPARPGPAPFSGEVLGPMPTTALGNGGPARQSRSSGYASAPSAPATDSDSQPADLLIFRWLVALNWATVVPRLRRVPVSLVQAVSHERIVLTATAASLDAT